LKNLQSKKEQILGFYAYGVVLGIGSVSKLTFWVLALRGKAIPLIRNIFFVKKLDIVLPIPKSSACGTTQSLTPRQRRKKIKIWDLYL